MRRWILLTLVLLILVGSTTISAQDEIKENPNAPANYDANLAPGTMAIGIGGSSPERIKIVSKSGGVYKAMSQESPNPYVVYYKANSVYSYFDPDKLRGLVDEYRYVIEPYVGWYAAKHNLSEEVLKGDGFQFDIGHSSDLKELKTRLDRELPKLAQLENRLSEIESFPETFTEFQYNPALVKEVATLRNEAYQAILNVKNSRRAEESVWLMAHRDGIRKALKIVNEYDPATKTTMGTDSEYALYAVSQKARAKWLADKNALEFKDAVDALLAPLAEALAKRLPNYPPPLKEYSLRSPAEEAMMRRVLSNPARYKIFSSGMMPGGWKIETNSLGIPTARYKHGMIYLRDLQGDHPYCYATYVNIVQSYAGGGTYAASRPVLAGDAIVACPAGS